MPETTEITLPLHGAWRVDSIGERLSFLVGSLERLCHDPPATVRLDLRGVEAIDACGCQLLLLFAETMKLRGIAPLSCAIPEAVRETMETLGFAALAAAEAEAGEAP